MGYFEDTRTCADHGFVLSPEGVCLRCVTDAERARRRQRAARIATGATVLVASLLGFSAARARGGSAEPTAYAVSPVVAVPEVPAPASAPATVGAREETARPADDWDRSMARAETERRQAAIAQARAEKQREVAALVVPTPDPTLVRRSEPVVASAPDPAFAPTRVVGTRFRRGAAGVLPTGGVNGQVTSPAAWGLPANNGGYFRNRNGGH